MAFPGENVSPGAHKQGRWDAVNKGLDDQVLSVSTVASPSISLGTNQRHKNKRTREKGPEFDPT